MEEIYTALQLASLSTLVNDVVKVALPIALITFGVLTAFRLFKALARG